MSTSQPGSFACGLDWSEINERVQQRVAQEHGRALRADWHHGGEKIAYEALIEILGADWIRRTTEAVLCLEPGWIAGQSVLGLLKPPLAAEICLSAIKSDQGSDRIERSVELLYYVLRWTDVDQLCDLFGHSNQHVRHLAAMTMLDFAHVSTLDEPPFKAAVVAMEASSDEFVRRQAVRVRSRSITGEDPPDMWPDAEGSDEE